MKPPKIERPNNKATNGIHGNTGVPLSTEHKTSISKTKTGTEREEFSTEHKRALSDSHTGSKNGMFGETHSDATKKLIRDAQLGSKQSAETIAKKAAKSRGTTRNLNTCPHCQKSCAVNVYPRYHGDNCKLNPTRKQT